MAPRTEDAGKLKNTRRAGPVIICAGDVRTCRIEVSADEDNAVRSTSEYPNGNATCGIDAIRRGHGHDVGIGAAGIAQLVDRELHGPLLSRRPHRAGTDIDRECPQNGIGAVLDKTGVA